MIATKAAPMAVAQRGLRTALPLRSAAAGQQRSSVIMRFREEKSPVSASDVDNMEEKLHTGKKTDTNLSPEEIDSLRFKDPGQKIYWPASRVSPESAEMRADLGNATDFWQAQTFDGPGPETINSRLSMLGVVIGLAFEWTTGLGLAQQCSDHPVTVFGIFLLITFASYVPIARGYTRKEPYANNNLGLNWTPKAENWNGRIAMMGFLGMVVTELITGMNTLQAWGIQDFPFLPK